MHVPTLAFLLVRLVRQKDCKMPRVCRPTAGSQRSLRKEADGTDRKPIRPDSVDGSCTGSSPQEAWEFAAPALTRRRALPSNERALESRIASRRFRGEVSGQAEEYF